MVDMNFGPWGRKPEAGEHEVVMRIHAPEVVPRDGGALLRARVEIDTPGLRLPESLEFGLLPGERVEGPAVAPRAEAFAVGLLPVAMGLGESLRIEGPLSPRLALGLRSWAEAVSMWWPERFRFVPVEPASFEAPPGPRAAGVASCFSGGVDSFYTLWRHRPPREAIPGAAISHALLIQGFDKDTDAELFRRLDRAYRPVLAELGAEPLRIRTNLREFRLPVLGPRGVVQSFGPFLAACGHALSAGIGRLYLAGHASYAHADLFPVGSHVALDHLLSAENLEVSHDGAECSRSDKIRALLDVPAARDALRVCVLPAAFDPDTGAVRNCCRCGKCLRTMVTLDLYDDLTRWTAFPLPLERSRVRTMEAESPSARRSLGSAMAHARRAGRRDRALDLRLALWWNRLRAPIRKLRQQVS